MIQERTGSATIYQFPVGGRAGQRTQRGTQRHAIADAVMPSGSALAVGESWYHADAIQDAERTTIS